jgi:excisionase family DNA binding protein
VTAALPALAPTEPLARVPLLLTVEETAEILRTSKGAIYDMAERGKLPGAVHIGRRLLVRRADLLGFVAGRGSSTGGTCR